ncbi:MAG: biotin-dependent carboxyltransferase [Deltaproteobacteria bacterium]|nr:biotin-dependent carboxyltransferase [Deltaproteobacteria bacterium]
MTDTFFVRDPGVLTTIQDMGRVGFGHYGIPVSGAMDRFALRTANLLVGNDPGSAGLEITLFRLKLEVLRTVRAAVTGGDMAAMLDGVEVPMWQTVELPRGSTFYLKAIRRGGRAYMAVEGGIDAPVLLESRSTHQRTLLGRPIQKGDLIRTLPAQREAQFRALPEEHLPQFFNEAEIRVVMGPQDDYFTKEGIRTFLGRTYTITSESDRMGYRLEGPPIQHVSGADIISDPILPGAIQVPGNGQPIIMMLDAQTTGGYTKIACVINPDIDVLAQMLPGNKVRFRQVSIDEAHGIIRAYMEKLARLEDAMIPV